MRKLLACLAVVGLGAVGAAYYVLPPTAGPWTTQLAPRVERAAHAAKPTVEPARVAKVECDNGISTITASGMVKPDAVEVGAQVNGMVVGPDPTDPSTLIDQGSIVHKGTVLARIDPTVYKAQVDYAQASLAKAKADLWQLQAKCDEADNEWRRAKSLLPEKAIAGNEYDVIASNYHVAMANVAVGRAAVQQAEAQLQIAKTYLDYTVIRSPIDGVVIDRRVNVGQTVMAVFNAPALFVIAKDLRRVQVWASVDEADIGEICPALPVHFSVEAYPDELFEGKVTEIRLNPTKVQNRTTYTVVVAANNTHGMLPYLSATLCFNVDRHTKAASISNLGSQPVPPPPTGRVVCATTPNSSAIRAGEKRPAPGMGGSPLPKPLGPIKKPGHKATGQVRSWSRLTSTGITVV